MGWWKGNTSCRNPVLSSIVQKKFICVSNRIGNNQQRTWMQASHVIEEGHAIPTWGAGRVRGEEG
jgi:hypothetical protein